MRPEAAEPGEIALILLRNAVRLLDQSMAPAEAKNHLRAAIRELERHVGLPPT